jgi:hypothetical protein
VATSASEKLQMTILKCCRYMGVEWDMSLHEVLGAVEQAKLTLWNDWDNLNPPDLDSLIEFDADDDDEEDDE